jgi:hypothetical protein
MRSERAAQAVWNYGDSVMAAYGTIIAIAMRASLIAEGDLC